VPDRYSSEKYLNSTEYGKYSRTIRRIGEGNSRK
jgi:hypothetical protein